MTLLQRFGLWLSPPEAKIAALEASNRELVAALGRSMLETYCAQATVGLLSGRAQQLARDLQAAREELARIKAGATPVNGAEWRQ